MGLCKTSNVSIFTFINASNSKCCPRSYSSCVYHMVRFKGLNGKDCKMMASHFGTLLQIIYRYELWIKNRSNMGGTAPQNTQLFLLLNSFIMQSVNR